MIELKYCREERKQGLIMIGLTSCTWVGTPLGLQSEKNSDETITTIDYSIGLSKQPWTAVVVDELVRAAPNCVSHECRLQYKYLFECHMFGIILTATNSGRGDIARLLFEVLISVPTNLGPFKKAENNRKVFARNIPFFPTFSSKASRSYSRYSKACK